MLSWRGAYETPLEPAGDDTRWRWRSRTTEANTAPAPATSGPRRSRNGAGWAEYLARPLDPDAVVHEVDKTDGYQRWAPVGFRLAQALHHGTDHRSQVCTALTTLGVEPPEIDVYDFGLDTGRIMDKMPDA